jgi:hypothetical protein
VTLPEVIPLFPLPNVVFFPRMPLPLHVFEPRYRAMVRDAAGGPRLVGMVLLRDDWERDYHGRAPIFATGTVGEMVRIEERSDGRYDIVLRGLREYAIVRELPGRSGYREAAVRWREPAEAAIPAALRQAIGALVHRYLARIGEARGAGGALAASADDETFVNFFAQHLDVAPLEKQALLEAPTLTARARRLVDVLEFRLEELRVHPGAPPPRTH